MKMNRSNLLFAVSLVTASYQVPLPPSQASLAPYAAFQIPSVRESTDGDQISFTYNLPADLVGPDAGPITLSGTIVPGQPLELEGENAQATCSPAPASSGDGQNAVCQVEYKDLAGLGVNESQVQQYLERNVQDPSELKARQTVQALFEEGPIGILTYPIAGPLPR